MGENHELFGPRFPAVTHTYQPALRDVVKAAAVAAGPVTAARLREGVYANVSGPTYETRHEIGVLRRLGCDAGAWIAEHEWRRTRGRRL